MSLLVFVLAVMMQSPSGQSLHVEKTADGCNVCVKDGDQILSCTAMFCTKANQIPPEQAKPKVQPEMPPLIFHLHGETWYLMRVDTLPDFDLGRMSCSARLIRFIPQAPKDLADTIWHEVLHAFSCKNGEADDTRFNNSNNPKDGWEGHKGTYDLAHELTAFTANNPALINYLEQAGK